MTQLHNLEKTLEIKFKRKLVIDYIRKHYYNAGLMSLNEFRKFDLDMQMNPYKVIPFYGKIINVYTAEEVDQEVSDLKENAELSEWVSQKQNDYISSFSN